MDGDRHNECGLIKLVDGGKVLEPSTEISRETLSSSILDCMHRRVDRRVTSD
jgi:hypothetical protein